jgi:hypothetical protein
MARFEPGHKKLPSAGRQKGTTNKTTAEIKALAFKSAPEVIAELKRLALNSRNEAVRVSACKELLDRAIGKAVQPVSDGTGPAVIQVITGVPRAEVAAG